MSFFKKKLHVEAGMRNVLHALLSRDLDRAFGKFADADILTPEDIKLMKIEIPPFDVATTLGLFIEYFGEEDALETGRTLLRRLPTALGFALQDLGLAEELLEARLEDLVNRSGTYLVSLESVPEKELDRAGGFFWYCHEFRERIIPAAVAQSEAVEERRLQVFGIARQNYAVAKQVLKSMTDTYKLVIQ